MLKNKKSSELFIEEDENEPIALTKYCEWKNCNKKGEYKAPTSRNQLREFKWFCLEHVKIYNKGWDYFKGRTSDEIYKEVSDDPRWHRPTWVREKKFKFVDSHNILYKQKNKQNKNSSKTIIKDKSNKIEISLKVMNMSMPFNLSDLKKQYKKMVKKFHPDVNKNNNEEYIISLNNAYSELLNFLKK